MPVTAEQIDDAVAVARRYGASRVVLFGRALTDPEHARDLDLAVGGVSGWTFFEMAADMESTLRIPLDVIPLDKESPLRGVDRSSGEYPNRRSEATLRSVLLRSILPHRSHPTPSGSPLAQQGPDLRYQEKTGPLVTGSQLRTHPNQAQQAEGIPDPHHQYRLLFRLQAEFPLN